MAYTPFQKLLQFPCTNRKSYEQLMNNNKLLMNSCKTLSAKVFGSYFCFVGSNTEYFMLTSALSGMFHGITKLSSRAGSHTKHFKYAKRRAFCNIAAGCVKITTNGNEREHYNRTTTITTGLRALHWSKDQRQKRLVQIPSMAAFCPVSSSVLPAPAEFSSRRA